MATKERERKAPRNPKRRTQPEKPVRSNAPEVVYIPARPFNRNRLILKLVSIVAVVLAIVLGISVFFKVDSDKISVSGHDKYSRDVIVAASGLKGGENLMTFSRAQAAGRIISALPYVERVRIGIKLPDIVYIEVVEVKVPYAIESDKDGWWLISAGGKVIEKASNGAQSGYTQLLGVKLDAPKVGEQAKALENTEPNLDEQGNPIPVTVTQAQRLQTALEILNQMELNGILGEATSVNVADLADLRINYGQRFDIKLGKDDRLAYKISCMKYVIGELDDYQSGELDISFTTWPNSVGYTPADGNSSSDLEIPS